MTFYDEMEDVSAELIEEFGREVQLTKITWSGPSYNRTQTPVDYTAKALDLNVKTGDRDESGAQDTVRTLYLTPKSPVVPKVGDNVTIDDKKHKIIDLRPLQPGGQVLFWEIDIED